MNAEPEVQEEIPQESNGEPSESDNISAPVKAVEESPASDVLRL